ncbi:MAG: FHA domain-containing protein [Oligoflexia bacterium]|nr:FHA domain-containing protein [Oligoflexia bacterium]
MAGQKVLILKNFNLPKEEGEYYRLLCLSGAKKGESFFLTADRLVIGRSNEADIQVVDGKSSREHAELVKTENYYTITDLGSQNGVIVNDLKVTQQKLRDGDKVIIGQTVFKYNIVNVNNKKNLTLLKSADGKSLPSIPEIPGANSVANNSSNNSNSNSNNELNTNTGDENAQDIDEKPSSSLFQKFAGLDSKTKMKVLVVVAVLGGFIFMDDKEATDQEKDPNKDKAPKGKDISSEVNSLIQKKKASEDKELERNLNVIFLRGLREAREGNYFRAISEFNLALILSPQNARASYYRDKTLQKLDEDIKKHFIMGRRFRDALRYSGAITEYCAILRLLENYPTDQRFLDAETNIKEIEKLMGLDEGETKCISK